MRLYYFLIFFLLTLKDDRHGTLVNILRQINKLKLN